VSARIRGLQAIDPSSNIELVECMISGTASAFYSSFRETCLYRPRLAGFDLHCLASRRSFLPSRPNLSLRYALAPISSRVSKLSGHKQTNPASADGATHHRPLVVQDWRIVAASKKTDSRNIRGQSILYNTGNSEAVSSARAQTDKAMGAGREWFEHPPSTIHHRFSWSSWSGRPTGYLSA
jgi:hypothetical protein